jgi:A/G-specific adenine glycosylase
MKNNKRHCKVLKPARDTLKNFQEKVLQYYRQHGRDLPWRKTTDPYKILVSEVMLQQTQVDRVIHYYERWVERWPTVYDLAKADRSAVLTMWMGLGYNNRAVHLHNAAQTIVADYDGDVIRAMNHYKNIPGIGPYISHAVRIFAGNEDIVTVDTNIRRIFIHEFQLDEHVSGRELWHLAAQCLPKGYSRDWHNALMDYGAMIVTSRKTGIKPKTRQSKFEGSDRQLRAQILRYFLETAQPLLFDEIVQFTHEQSARVQNILNGMMKDGLIEHKDKRYSLKN